MKVFTVVGARPQFIKCARVSRILRKKHKEILVHTGQHYDRIMSDVFFDQLGIPEPDHNLGVQEKSHAKMTALMMTKLEAIMARAEPDWCLLYGDTNSTLAGALAAAKLKVPIAHVEAGVRSYNRQMPEEINRILTDHVSTLLFCPTEMAGRNLKAEGITKGVHNTGDVMLDTVLEHKPEPGVRSSYVLATLHRAENVDDADRLRSILKGLGRLGTPVFFLVHPRTQVALKGVRVPLNIQCLEPTGYVDFLSLAAQAKCICTDSGGVQKEAYWLGTPCVTLRDETEWWETINEGANVLAGADADAIVRAVEREVVCGWGNDLYGDGHAAEKIVARLMK